MFPLSLFTYVEMTGPYLLLSICGVLLAQRGNRTPAAFVAAGFALALVARVTSLSIDSVFGARYLSSHDEEALAQHANWVLPLFYTEFIGKWVGSLAACVYAFRSHRAAA